MREHARVAAARDALEAGRTRLAERTRGPPASVYIAASVGTQTVRARRASPAALGSSVCSIESNGRPCSDATERACAATFTPRVWAVSRIARSSGVEKRG